MKGFRSILAAAALGSFLAVSGVHAQTPPADESGNLSSLLFLKGSLVQVSYSPGSLDRAVRLQRRFELQSALFAKWSGTKVPVNLYLLAPAEWRRANLGLPFGIPVRLPSSVLALPAWADDGAVELWRGLLGSELPEFDAMPLRGTATEAASLELTDALGQAEAARMLLTGAGLSGAELWINEVLAQAVARSARERLPRPADARIDAAYAAVRRGRPPLSLAAYTQGVALEDWLWFQATFHHGAELLAAEVGREAAKPLLKLLRKRARGLDSAALFERFPVLAGWYRESFAGARPGGAG